MFGCKHLPTYGGCNLERQLDDGKKSEGPGDNFDEDLDCPDTHYYFHIYRRLFLKMKKTTDGSDDDVAALIQTLEDQYGLTEEVLGFQLDPVSFCFEMLDIYVFELSVSFYFRIVSKQQLRIYFNIVFRMRVYSISSIFEFLTFSKQDLYSDNSSKAQDVIRALYHRECITNRLTEAGFVRRVKFYPEHIHKVKSSTHRKALAHIKSVKEAQSNHAQVSQLVSMDDNGDELFLSQDFRFRMEITFDAPPQEEGPILDPSPELFAHILPIMQQIKNQVRLLHMSSIDIHNDFDAANYWIGTNIHHDAGVDIFGLPKSIRNHNPFTGYGKMIARNSPGKNNMTEIGRHIYAVWVNQLGVFDEKFGRLFANEGSGRALTIQTNENAHVANCEFSK